MEIVFGWFVLSIVAGWWAGSKGRSGIGVFILSLVFSPLVGLITAAAMDSSAEQEKQTDDEEKAWALSGGVSRLYRKCHACAEVVRLEAVKCRYCGAELPPIPAAAPAAPKSSPRARSLGYTLGAMWRTLRGR